MKVLNDIATRAIEEGGRLRVRSALNPVLWLCGIVTVPSLALYAFFPSHPVWLIVLAFLPVLTAITGFFILLFVDRDKLQSEDYQIRMRSLEVIEQQGDQKILLADVVPLEPNTDVENLSLQKEEQQ